MGADGAGAGAACVAELVDVDGHQAVWIFSEFETDDSLDDLVDWLEPERWPVWGGQMFKELKLLGTRTPIPCDDGEQWHATYLEVVSLAGRQLDTVLGCEFKRTDSWAATTYELDHSVDDMLVVDRGFLLALDVAGRRQVKALKVVGFTDTVTNALATAVCPEWAEWIQAATTTAARQVAGAAGPTVGAVGDDDPRSQPAGAGAAAFTQGYAEAWTAAAADAARFYGEYATDVGGRLWSGRYSQQDAAQDTSRLWLRVASDWSRTWRAGMDAASQLAEVTVPATGGVGSVPGGLRGSVEFTTALVAPPAQAGRVSVGDLARVGPQPAVLRASEVQVAPEVISPDTIPAGVRLTADTTRTPPGLYAGELVVDAGGAQARHPALFYVAHARPAG